MSKKYEDEGNLKVFNNKRFSELVDSKAKEKECAKTWIFKEIAKYLKWSIDDNGNKIYRWYKGKNAPVDLTIVKDVSDYFGVDYNQLLLVNEKGKEIMENNNKTLIKVPLKKVQQDELIKVKDAILDYVYDNFTSAFWEDYVFSEYGFDHNEKLSLRLMERKNKTFDADMYFSKEELKQITEERLLEEETLKNSNSKKRPDVSLLDEYRTICENGKLYELMRKIERSLSVLPFKLVNSIMQIVVNALPDGRTYLYELCDFNGIVSKHYSSFDAVIDPDFVYDPDDEDEDEIRRDSTYNIVMNVHKQLNELINKYCE